MNHEESIQCALGYAWGREDASNIKTAEQPNRVGAHQFADAFQRAWDEYNAGARFHMIPVRQAYEQWQASDGAGIFEPYDTTESQQARAAAQRAACTQ